jgi:hypothetical protein
MNGGSETPVDTVDTTDGEIAPDAERSISAPVTQEGNQRSISYEEFDPKGTLALILVYLVVLGVMWVFMYFVEFLGNELVVVG